MEHGVYKFRHIVDLARNGELSFGDSYLFFRDTDNLDGNSDVWIGDMHVDDAGREIYSEEIRDLRFNEFVDPQIFEDVVQNVFDNSDDSSLDFIIKAFRYYLENDTFLV